MTYTLPLLLIISLIALMVIVYRRPGLAKTADFQMTRKFIILALFCYAVISASTQIIAMRIELSWVVPGIALSLCWIFLILSFRGIFEILGLPLDPGGRP